jgi:filamentous hemagglutinin
MKSRTKRTHRFSTQLAGFMRGPATTACTLLLFVACWSLSVSMCASAAGPVKSGSVALNLTSTQATLSGSSALGSLSSVKILVGNTMQTITGTSLLTPGEYLAAIQMATAGKQSIILSNSGSATGGTFTTNSVSQTISALVIPSGVTAVDNFAGSKTFSLTGDLVNSGTFYAVSTSKSVSTAGISAADITNSGLLTSIVPAGGISGFSNLIGNLGLSLTAINNIVNHGTISSAGGLALTAGNSITNSTIGSTPALIQSAAGLTMSAPTIVSGAQISALRGNVSILTNSFTNSSLLQAMQGTLSFQNLSGSTLQIAGGTLDGTALSLTAKNGSILANVVDLPSSVDITANTYDMAVSNGTQGLNLTHIPTLTRAVLSYNGIGDVTFHGFSTLGGNVDVNTTGNISVLGPGNSQLPGNINTSPASGSAGSVMLEAGGALSVGNVTATGAGNGNGGNITLDAGTTVTAGALDASGGLLSGGAGKITITAGASR